MLLFDLKRPQTRDFSFFEVAQWPAEVGILPELDSRPLPLLQRLDHLERLRALPEDGLGSLAPADGEWPDQQALEALGVPERTAALMATSTRSLFSTTTSSYAAG